MTEILRTDERHFDALPDWPYEPHYHHWKDVRIHYVDEGPPDGPVMLLMHGMPTWGYLYRAMIPVYVAAGFRCIVPDHAGFGRSDKPTDPAWYSIARHTEILTSLITSLDLQNVTLHVQDWGGPIGLAQAATMPERFDRLVIMNTWLHHPAYEYSPAIKNWIAGWHEGGPFFRERPNLGLIPLMAGGLIDPPTAFGHLTDGTEPELVGELAANYAAWSAPWRDLGTDAFHGARWFPLSIPHNDYDSGNGAAQTSHFHALLHWDKPVRFIWGGSDSIFTSAWGQSWAQQMQASFDEIPDAGHFLQDTHGAQIAEMVLDGVG